MNKNRVLVEFVNVKLSKKSAEQKKFKKYLNDLGIEVGDLHFSETEYYAVNTIMEFDPDFSQIKKVINLIGHEYKGYILDVKFPGIELLDD